MRAILRLAVAVNFVGACASGLAQDWFAMVYALVAAAMSFSALVFYDALRRTKENGAHDASA